MKTQVSASSSGMNLAPIEVGLGMSVGWNQAGHWQSGQIVNGYLLDLTLTLKQEVHRLQGSYSDGLMAQELAEHVQCV